MKYSKIISIYYILCFVLIIMIYNTVVQQKYNESIWIDFINISKKRNISMILFFPFIGCGYSNKIPTLVSSFLLSLVSFHPIFIVDWPQLLFYFQFPKSLFIQHHNRIKTNTYNRKNNTILNLLKINESIAIYTFHSFTNSVLQYYNLTKNLKILIKQKQKYHISLDMILQKIFLQPTERINNYIRQFKYYTKRNCIVGIHIRTGYLSDFGEKDKRFFNNKSIALYINTINRVISKYRNCKLFIISDSTIVKDYFFSIYKNRILKYTISGKICHARYAMHGDVKLNECVVKLIAENYLLSECEIIIGSRKSTFFGMACNRSVVKCISL